MDKQLFELLAYTVDGTHKPRVALAAPEDGKIAVEGSTQYKTSLDAVQEWMRQIGMSSKREDHELFAASILAPIRTLARYKAWTQIFFAPQTFAPTEDNRVALDNPIGNAFISSPEGRPQVLQPGAQLYTTPSFFEVAYTLEVQWNMLRTTGWAFLQRRLEECTDAMASRVDVKARAILDAAIATVSGHRTSVSGGVLTKAGVDSTLKEAAAIGFPIVQAAINPARLMDMTGWTNGSDSAHAFFRAPEWARDQVFKQLWADGYGNIRWFISHSVPRNSIYLSGDPIEIGYHQDRGMAQSASDIDIERRVDKHAVWEEHAFYVGNAYNLWEIIIQP
jgi:hypothetical protein